MRWPAKLKAGVEVHDPAITMDLTATFAVVAGAAPPPGHELDGVNLLPLLTGEIDHLPERTFCWRIARNNRRMRAIRRGNWKYIDDGGTMDLLFDLSSDVGERNNLVYERQAIVADLKQRLVDWEAEVEGEPKTFRVR